MRGPTSTRFAYKLLAASLGLALVPFWGLCFYNQPYLDDYAWATLFRQRGWWGAQVFLYHHLNGRFVASWLLTGLNPLAHGGPRALGLASLALSLATLGSLWLGLHSLLRDAVRPAGKLGLAGGVFLLFVAIIPDIYSALYWYASQVTHHLASLFLLLTPVSIARWHRATGRAARLGWLGLAATGAIVAGGSSELVALLLGWLLAMAVGISLARGRYRHAGPWAGLLLVLAGAAGLDIRAPANLSRLHPATPDVRGIVAGLAQFWHPAWLAKALQLLLLQPGTLLVLAAPLLLRPWAARLVAVRPAGFRLPLAFSGGVLLGGILLGASLMQLEIATPYIASRCANVLLWWLLLGWLAACWAALPAGPAPPQSSLASRAGRYLIGSLLFIFILAPVLRAWREVLVEAPNWNRQCQRRYAWLRRAARHDPHVSVQFAPIRGVVPRYVLIRGYDIATTYNTPYNRDMARYFGVDSVRVDPRAGGAAF